MKTLINYSMNLVRIKAIKEVIGKIERRVGRPELTVLL